MGPIRSLIALAATAVIPFGTGCAAIGFGKDKKETPFAVPAGIPSAGLSAQVKPGDSGVVQAGGIAQSTTALSNTLPAALSWMTGKEKATPKGPAVSIIAAWQNRVDYLPDPVRDGELGPGLAGQIFLLNTRGQAASADGTITVDLYDETPRAPGVSQNKPERWQFKKDVLKNLRMEDERFGPCYGIFLPWPTYRPDVTRVRVKVRYDPEQGGFPLYAEEMRISLDMTLKTVSSPVVHSTMPMGTRNPQFDSTGSNMFGGTQPPAAGGPTTGPGMGVFVMGGGKPAGQVPSAAPNGTLPPAPTGYGAMPPAQPGMGRAPAELPPMTPIVPGAFGGQ